MTSGSSPSQQPFQPSASEEHRDGPQEAAGPQPSLDDVVRQTLDVQGGDESLAPEVWEGLLDVARRHAPGDSLELPVIAELVEAVLTCRFEQFRQQSGARALAARRIAETLWDDMPSRTRLERLWEKLREESR